MRRAVDSSRLRTFIAELLDDVSAMIDRKLVDADRLQELLEEIEPQLYRFPAVDPAALRAAVNRLGRRGEAIAD